MHTVAVDESIETVGAHKRIRGRYGNAVDPSFCCHAPPVTAATAGAGFAAAGLAATGLVEAGLAAALGDALCACAGIETPPISTLATRIVRVRRTDMTKSGSLIIVT